MKCTKCNTLYTRYFPEDFLALSSGNKEVRPNKENYWRSIGNDVYSLGIWSSILNDLENYSKGDALLEVGIGKGELLAVALEMGYEPDAVEIIEEAQKVSDMLGIPIWNGDFLNYETEKKYSKIIMGDVIEHVTDPRKALEKAYSLLDDDGVLWLSTPNYNSSYSRIKKFSDPMWCEPYHITYFSKETLSVLLEECGFEIRKYNVSSRYNGSMEMIITKKR